MYIQNKNIIMSKSLEKIAFVAAALAGGVFGVMYSQKSGKALRKRMEASDAPVETLVHELLGAGEEFVDDILDTDHMQTIMKEYQVKKKDVAKTLKDMKKNGGKTCFSCCCEGSAGSKGF